MIHTEKVKALAFDFGGTLDSPFMHWMKIYLKLYGEELHLPLTGENFRDSYVYAEQMMERLQLVKTSHSLLETQSFKTRLQFDDLIRRGILPDTQENREELPERAARLVTDFSSRYVILSKESHNGKKNQSQDVPHAPAVLPCSLAYPAESPF